MEYTRLQGRILLESIVGWNPGRFFYQTPRFFHDPSGRFAT